MVKISVVTAGRDPSYGTNLIERTMIAYKRNMAIVSHNNIDVDWVFIEWNPTEELISTWLASQGVRCYIVPTNIHDDLVHPAIADRYLFMEGFAKNVGMRKAKHEWMIVSNVDNLYSPDIWDFIKQEKFDSTVMYRAERRDVPFDLFDCEFPKMEQSTTRIYNIANKLHHAAGDFMMLSSQTNPGYDENMTDTNVWSDGHLCYNWTEHLGYTMQQIGKVYKATHPLIMRNMRKQAVSHKGFKRSKVVEGTTPYTNTPNWGLVDCSEIKLSDNIWTLQ